MAAAGEVTPMPVAAIFADTQDEPASVYEWLEWLKTKLPFPVIEATAGHLIEAATTIRTSKKSGLPYIKPTLPLFFKGAKKGFGMRQCTENFKIVPIRRAFRARWRSGVMWIGISTDEAIRRKDSKVKYLTHRFPLLEAGMSRADCQRWLALRFGKTAPRSACRYCPHRSNASWLALKQDDPFAFRAACRDEVAIQDAYAATQRYDGIPFLHADRIPLSEVELEKPDQQTLLSGFRAECEGMCGV